jgi:hypothetical protein
MRRECQICGQWDCTCQVKDVKPRREEYVIRYCAADGCDVRIREHIERPGNPLCKWCQEREQGKGFPHESYAKRAAVCVKVRAA